MEEDSTGPANPAKGSAVEELSGILTQRFRAGRATRTVVYQFCIDNEDWTLTVGPESFGLQDGQPAAAPDCYLKTTREILLGAIRGQYTPSVSDFLTGKIRSNNPHLLLLLRDVFGEA